MASQKVLVAGTGRSGISAARLMLAMGGEVVLYDGNPNLKEQELIAEFEEKDNISVVLGELKRTDLVGVELCVISPGIPLESALVATLDEAKIPIWSEIQLAYQCAKGKLIAITGTNGKTTTTALTGQMLKDCFEQVFVAGNIGLPFTQVALETTDESYTVVEVSSFQLETIMDFKPRISAILNITPDHLDRHGTMERYSAVKKLIAVNQTEEDIIVLNYDDPVLRDFGLKTEAKEPAAEEGVVQVRLKAKPIFFSSRQNLEDGFCLAGDTIVYNRKGKSTEVLGVSELPLLGRHNYENVMAAVAMATAAGVGLTSIRKTLRAFKGVEHRIEFVLERYGVKYYNDSKATNPDAAIKAIEAMPGPVLLIAGGYDKNGEYNQWVKTFEHKVKYLVLIGQTRDKIAKCARENGFTEIMYAEDMPEAVKVCASYADSGDYVLLSPACASFGMFKDFEERGKVFKEAVLNL